MNWVDVVVDIPPATVGFIGACAIVALVLLDVIAGQDEIQRNTPREQVLVLTQWSCGWFAGGAVPFALGGLLGHFFHPWLVRPPLTSSWTGMALVIGLAIGAGFVAGRLTASGESEAAKAKRGEKVVFYFVVAGIAAGALLWPVGPFR